FKSYGFISQINAFTLGIREGKNIQYEDFSLMKLPLPTLQEQQSIATYLDQKCGEIDELIALQEEMITKLQSYKQSVITEAVTKGLDKNAPLKDSGIEWIGEIPEHWKVVKIKYLAKIKSGDSISSNEVNQEGVYEVYGGNGLMGYCNKKNVDGFNIIIGRVGALCGNVRLISESKYITDNALILNCFDGVLCPYMYIMLKAANLNNLNTSNAQPLITGSKVLNVSLPIPPLPEQQSIADYLDRKCGEIDELISIKQQKIEKLKDYKKSLIFECVTGKRKVC
ncbi:MAG: restriction endonuclease subunit S, partial [Candidatus Paraprevotella stercoravium]|nr:restriction endonuclease subunit S [Candidatus Paraprevotella stercoravium]